MIRPRRKVPIVTGREYDGLTLPRALDTAATRERLQAAGRRAGLRTFEARGTSLYALGIVGVVDIGNLIVEILPKSSQAASPLDGAAFLGRLLSFIGSGRQPKIAEASIRADGGGLFEVILSWTVDQAADHIAAGLPRRYVPATELSTAVRGRIDLRHLALQRPGRAFELRVRHAPLSEDNAVARIIRWLMGEVARRTTSTQTRARALQLLDAIAHVRETPPRLHELDKLVLSPHEAHWRPLIVLARSLLMQVTPDPARAGDLDSLAVLYSLHGLFEEALRKILTQGLGSINLRSQRIEGTLLTGAGVGLIALKPDFRFVGPDHMGGIVGDAKWKRIFQGDGRIRLGEDDAYQITTYLTATGAERAFLISPIDLPVPPMVHRTFDIKGAGKPLTVVGIHLPALIADTPAAEALRDQLCRLVAGRA